WALPTAAEGLEEPLVRPAHHLVLPELAEVLVRAEGRPEQSQRPRRGRSTAAMHAEDDDRGHRGEDTAERSKSRRDSERRFTKSPRTAREPRSRIPDPRRA